MAKTESTPAYTLFNEVFIDDNVIVIDVHYQDVNDWDSNYAPFFEKAPIVVRFDKSRLYKIAVFAKSNKVVEELLGSYGLLRCLQKLGKGWSGTITTNLSVFGIPTNFDKAIEAGKTIAECIKDFANHPTH